MCMGICQIVDMGKSLQQKNLSIIFINHNTKMEYTKN